MLEWIDMHVHLDKLEEGPEEAIRLAKLQGVQHMITIGTDPADLPIVLALAKKYAPHVFCTLGIHPHEGSLYTQEVGDFIEANVQDSRVVAVGEIGLDYFYTQSPVVDQKIAFRHQLDIAKKFQMPVEIHTRDAEADTVEILREYQGSVKGLLHCFTGSEWLAKKALDLGFNISISGVVTFKNANALRDVVKMLPLDRLHIETDAPFLAPVPHRGKKNTPAYVVNTAEVVASIKGVSLAELAEQTKQNAWALFPKMRWS